MTEICFATNNANKLKEIQQMLGNQFKIVSLQDIGCHEDIAETADTIEGNSQIKARYVWDKYKVNCFADDTGLETYALNNEPGVYSARYAGTPKDDGKNMAKLLKNLDGKENRGAQFKTVVTLILNGEERCFEGIIKGNILTEPVGNQGFGYDPVFQPEGYQISFAQMDLSEKNQISHRARAVQKLVAFLAKAQ